MAVAVARLAGTPDVVLVFDDGTGQVVDLDVRGSDADILERLSHPAKAFVGRYRPKVGETSEPGISEDGRWGRGRPKLGVVAREVTLLPRQWEWLGPSRTARLQYCGVSWMMPGRRCIRARKDGRRKRSHMVYTGDRRRPAWL